MSFTQTPEAWLFYISNVVIVAGYFMAALLITRRKSFAKDISWRAWVAGLSFFALCGATHADLAYHALFNLPIIRGGDLDPHWLIIHVPQAVSIWAFLLTIQERPTRQSLPPPPLEGTATSWVKDGEST